MSDMSDVCTLCKADIASVFTAPPRQPTVLITADKHVPGPCFVADQLEFRDKGRLIFDINPEQRFPEYAVICRKLIINGGNKPVTTNPCNPADPGTRYNTNVITWNGRLTAAASGPDFSPPTAAFNSAHDGMPGADGATGNQGASGAGLGANKRKEIPAVKLVLVAVEVEFINSGNLVIDWAGQDGGDGGKGQNGAKGDKGTKGGDGQDASWPSSGCDIGTGSGGDGGPGGAGGKGGQGGDGGDSGQIIIISLPEYIGLSGLFNDSSKVTIVTASVGGKGGPGGHGGDGGAGGDPGKPSSECGLGSLGGKGTSFLTLFGDQGVSGGGGNALAPVMEALGGACANLLPIPLQFDSSNVLPQVIRRCFSGSGNGEMTLTGQFLDQVVAVSSNLAGVTATIKPLTSSDTQLDLAIAVAANSASGPGDLIFTYNFPGTFGATQTLSGAINVDVCQATAITPATGVHGTTVSVTITGQSFDPTAGFHDVTVSGLGVNAVNVAVVDDKTMTCDLIIDSTALKNTRDVVVKAGPGIGFCQYTLVQSFTVT